MLSLEASSKSTEVIIDVIKKLTGNTIFAEFEGIVTATIKNQTKINDEKINIHLSCDHRCARILVFWEDFGYKNYKDMGLFGKMDTLNQSADHTGKKTFTVSNVNPEYSIEIIY